MDLKARKLRAIEYLVNLQDEGVLRKIESAIIEDQNQEEKKDELELFTQEQIVERAKQSNKDYDTGKFITQEQLESDAENW